MFNVQCSMFFYTFARKIDISKINYAKISHFYDVSSRFGAVIL